MSSHLGKRKRGGGHVAVSALAARKAAQKLAEVPAREEESESEGTDEPQESLDDPTSDQRPSRYFVHPSAEIATTVEAVEEPVVLRAVSPIVSQPLESFSRPRIGLDLECTSTWRPKAGHNCFVEGQTVRLTMQTGERLVLRGVTQATVESGSVSVGGATLSNGKTTTIFAPTTSPLPVFQTTEAVTLRFEPQRTGVEGISRLAQAAGLIARGDDIWAERDLEVAPTGAGFDILLEPKPRLVSTKQPDSWQSAVAYACEALRTAERPIVLVSGLPRTGKTTLARILLISLLNEHASIAWLDCDLGQSEFTPAGFVSLQAFAEPLFGPSFCHSHPREGTRAHYIGAVEPRSHPRFYLNAIADLIAQYDGESHIPLVVNLPGWSKGLVADLQVSIERSLRASVQLHVGTEEDLARSDATPAHVTLAEPIGIETSEVLRLTSAAKRQLSLLSWLHSCPRDLVSSPYWDFTVPLLAQQPRMLPFRHVKLVQALLAASPPESELLHLLNGSLVALCTGIEDDNAESYMRYDADPVFRPGRNALGLALIRAIDSEASCLHVLTPLHPQTARTAHVLIRGSIEVPTVALIDLDEDNQAGVADVEWKDVPFLEAPPSLSGSANGVKGIVSGPRRFRRNLQRRSLVTRT